MTLLNDLHHIACISAAYFVITYIAVSMELIKDYLITHANKSMEISLHIA